MAYRLVRERRYENQFQVPALPPPPPDDDDVSDTEPLYDEWEDEDQEQIEQLEELQEIEQLEEKNDDDNKDQEECPICFSNYNSSNRQKYTITKCHFAHPLCRSCAVEMVNLARRRHQRPRCPMCREEFAGIENSENKTFSFGGFYKKTRSVNIKNLDLLKRLKLFHEDLEIVHHVNLENNFMQLCIDLLIISSFFFFLFLLNKS